MDVTNMGTKRPSSEYHGVERVAPFVVARLAAERELAIVGCPPWVQKPCRDIVQAVKELEAMAANPTESSPIYEDNRGNDRPPEEEAHLQDKPQRRPGIPHQPTPK